MRTDSVVRTDGMQALRDTLGIIDSERFVMLLLREPFGYTAWRARLNNTHGSKVF